MITDLLLYGSDKFDAKKNCNIFMSTLKFLKNLMDTYYNF